ncbi:McrC family protein [Pseudoalteromonas shioyasakiensis]|uniref:McrC family protein n=1 Tax=Pseudoalteromonas shioyasakiensis TaxID=1190813 RepID=UPI0021192CE0|nr:McrC family protein [Pseudoalteromonas shioyasakiensis]MCQ8878749.1 McrC family protein [Pseudoalteromonas shioyasakiensis]
MPEVKKQTTVFEFGYLGFCEKAQMPDRVEFIPQSAYDYLKGLCLCDESESRFLRLKQIDNCEVLQVKNYAGVIFTPDGTQIEVLPKVAKNSDDSTSRASLLMMLKSLKQFRHLQTNNANLAENKIPLLEVFISQFLASVNTLIKRGLKSDYVLKEDNVAFLKGKLLVGKQVKYNFINKHKFYVEYEEYLQDRPVNRLIHTALVKVKGYSRSANNQKLLQELLFAFADIPLSNNVKNDFASVKLDRGMKYYEVPLAWARLIIDGFSPLTLQGKSNAFSLLFPMEAVFESFVAQHLKQHIIGSGEVSAQVSTESLVDYANTPYFLLKPDLYISREGAIDKDNDIVLDTKWKLINEQNSKRKDKFGLSQSDFYQMLGYGHSYLNGKGSLVLIYPKTDAFKKPFEHSFNYKGGKLKLWVVPFDIEAECEKRIDLSCVQIDAI